MISEFTLIGRRINVYPTLNAELARRSMNKRKLAERTGINYTTLVSKLNGKGVLTLPDMRKIKDVIGTNISMEELFAEETDKPAGGCRP